MPARRIAPIRACVSASIKSYNQTLPLNATTKRYHPTQALMGATRLASG